MKQSFKERVIDFWQQFLEKETEVRTMMDSKADPKDLLSFVDAILNTAFEKIYFEMGINSENKYELILTPEGDKVKLIQLKYWQQMAPEHLKEKWNFYSSKPAVGTPDFSLSMYDIELGLNDVTFFAAIDEEKHKVDIEVYAPKMMSIDEDNRYTMLFIFLDQFISELYTMEYIGFIHISEEEGEGKAINAVELKALIDQTVAEKEWVKPEDIGHTYSSYKMNPTKESNWLLRQDIAIGITTNFDIINAFYGKTDELVKKYEEDGLTFGFLFYENINIPQKEVVRVRGQIEDKILEIAESKNAAQTIGGATGTYFSYMDFVIYDLDEFLTIAKEVLSQYEFKETGFSPFVFGVEPTRFN